MTQYLTYHPGISMTKSLVTTYFIYILKCPNRDEVFYVGITSIGLKERLWGHLSSLNSKFTPKNNYIKTILSSGKKPIIEEIEKIEGTCIADKVYAEERELYWIRYYKGITPNLTNNIGVLTKRTTDYNRYLQSINAKKADLHFYYCGSSTNGLPVYDEARLNKDGFSFVRPRPEPEEPKQPDYNPWGNPRFLEKLFSGDPPSSYKETWLDHAAYKDNDPTWYEQDNCTLFGY